MRSEDDEARAMTAGTPLAQLRYADVPATSDQLPPVRHALAEWAAATGLSAEQVDALTLAADEAMSNVVSHAYPEAPGTLDLLATQNAATGEVDVTVTDHGQWRPVPADPGPLHGRGLLLIRALAQVLDLDHGPEGTIVRMRWSPPQAAPQFAN